MALSPILGRLRNGLRVVVVELPHLHSATACVTIGCGGRHDPPGLSGLSHLLEHMLFRGSRRFADAQSLARAFELTGGMLQAATWRDHTSLWCPFHPSALRPVLAGLGDVLAFPKMDDLPLERRIVAEEMRGELDCDGGEADLTSLSRAALWPGHPMGQSLLGTPASLRRLQLHHLRAHHAKHYRAGNMVLCVAGPVDARQVMALAAATLGPLRAGCPPTRCMPPAFAPGARVVHAPGPGPQTGLQLTFPALPDGHPDFLAQELLVAVLDDGMASRLPYAICERRGLSYTLDSGLDCYRDAGLYDIEVHVHPRRAVTAVATVLEVLSDLRATGARADELAMCQRRRQHELEFMLDAPEDLAHASACAHLFGPPLDLAREARAVRRVGLDDLHRISQRLFAAGRAQLTVQGPLAPSALPRLQALLSRFLRAPSAARPALARHVG